MCVCETYEIYISTHAEEKKPSSPIQAVKMETSAEEEVSGLFLSCVEVVSGETLPSAG